MNVSPWNWNTTNISPVHPSVNQIPQRVVEGHEDLNDYHWVEDGYVYERSYPPIKLHATAAQVQAAYAALSNQGLPGDFAQEVWNDIVDKIAEVQIAFGIPEKDRLHNQTNQQIQNPKSAYISSETPGYVSSSPYGGEADHQNLGHALYAYKFNVLVNAFVALPTSWVWPWEMDGVEIEPGAPVKGSYIIALTQAINYWINQPQATFAGSIILRPFIMTTRNGGFDIASGTLLSRFRWPLNLSMDAEFELLPPGGAPTPVDDWVDTFDMSATIEDHEAVKIEQFGYFVEGKTVQITLSDVFYGIRKVLNPAAMRLNLTMSSTFSQYQGLPMTASLSFGFTTQVSTDTAPARTFAGEIDAAGLDTETEFDDRNIYPLAVPVEISSGMRVGNAEGKTNILSLFANYIFPLDLAFLFVYNDIRAERATIYELRYVTDKHWFVTEATLDMLTHNKELAETASMTFDVDCSLYVASPQETPRLQAETDLNFVTYATADKCPVKHLDADSIIHTEFIANAKPCYAVHPEIDASITFDTEADLGNDHLKELSILGTLGFDGVGMLSVAPAKEIVALGTVCFGDDASTDTSPRVHLAAQDFFTFADIGRVQTHRGVSMAANSAIRITAEANGEVSLPPKYVAAETAVTEVVEATLDVSTANDMSAETGVTFTAGGELDFIVGTPISAEGDTFFVAEVEAPELRRALYLPKPKDTTGIFYTVDDEIFLDRDGNNIVTALELFNVIRFNMELKGDMFITSDDMQLFTSDDKEFTPL